LSLSHDNLESYYRVNFGLMQHHKYSLSDIENMVPWEREIYCGMLMQFLKAQEEQQKKQNGT